LFDHLYYTCVCLVLDRICVYELKLLYPSRYSSGSNEYSAHLYPIRIACPPVVGRYSVRGNIPGAQLRYRLSAFIMNRAVDVYNHALVKAKVRFCGFVTPG